MGIKLQKRWIINLICILLLLFVLHPTSVFATEAVNISASANLPVGKNTALGRPRVVVDEYSVSGDGIIAGKQFDLSVTIQNVNPNMPAGSILLKVDTSSGLVRNVYGNSNEAYVNYLNAYEKATVVFHLEATKDISTETIPITLNINFADESAYENNNEVQLQIPVEMEGVLMIQNYSLPSEIYIGTKTRVSATYENAGMENLDDITMTVTGEGLLEPVVQNLVSLSGGDKNYTETYVDFIQTGKQKIQIEFSYKDANGTIHNVGAKEFTVQVEEKNSTVSGTSEPNQTVNRFWWLRMLERGVILAIIVFLSVILWRKFRKGKR